MKSGEALGFVGRQRNVHSSSVSLAWQEKGDHQVRSIVACHTECRFGTLDNEDVTEQSCGNSSYRGAFYKHPRQVRQAGHMGQTTAVVSVSEPLGQCFRIRSKGHPEDETSATPDC
jgi:hypothetical protein